MLRSRPRLTGFLMGLAVTLGAITFFFSSRSARNLELAALDWRLRHCNTLVPDPRIVHVDIDDNALERVGRWPWRRVELAQLIRALSELRPAHLMIDLLLSEYERPLLDDPRYAADSDVEPQAEVLGELAEANVVFGDLELADAMRATGNVVLAAQLDLAGGRGFAANEREALRNAVKERLQVDFTLDEATLAAALSKPREAVTAVIAGVKTEVARERVGKLFKPGEPTPTLEQALRSLLGERRTVRNADRLDVLAAYRTHRGLLPILTNLTSMPRDAADRLRRAYAIVPPHFFLAEAARNMAAVNFEADPDGVVRRVPPWLRVREGVLPHLGVAAAGAILDLDVTRASREADGSLTMPRGRDGQLCTLPLDADGNLLIHWARTARQWRSGGDLPHISAAKLWAMADARAQIETNRVARSHHLADVVAASKGNVTLEPGDSSQPTIVSADNAYRRAVVELLRLKRQARRARLERRRPEAEVAAMEARCAEQARRIEEEERRAVATIELNAAEIDQMSRQEQEADAEMIADVRRIKAAKALLDGPIARIDAANEAMERTIAELRAELAPRLEGKFVFLGFAATATGDIVSTAADPVTNGVMCHSHVLNSFLANRFLRQADRRAEIAACLLLGALVGLVTATRGPWFSLGTTAGLMAAYLAINTLVLFRRFDLWFALVAPLVTLFLVWAFVTLFRQFTAERDKRLFAKQLSQYTSPIIAARLAESPAAVAAFKTVQTRDMTCLFSDLAGFTSLSEQCDPEIVQHVLNTYLQRMSQVIWSYRGLINKFMGDGIMAFFNPSVDPLPDHVRAACDATLAAVEELERLKNDCADDPAAPILRSLAMRVGLASGRVKNGDLGSELKADYTVIGDVVNLAARLEPANKVFGTTIMVSGPLRDAVAGEYEFRYLAELQVKGKAQTVPVYELAGRKGSLSEEQQKYVERFEAGVALYKERKWDECIVHFMRLLARRPDDPGASRYIDACQEFKQFPPDESWKGALELKEK